MLLKSYTRDIFRADGNLSFVSVHCIARRDQDVAANCPTVDPDKARVLGGDMRRFDFDF
jgi:hypothetical protein